jgi:hypothetical protein
MLKHPAPKVEALIADALNAGNRDEAFRLYRKDTGGSALDASLYFEEVEAARQGRKTPSSLAFEICNLVRDGKITETEARRRMKRECPGFSRAAYDRALEEGYFESR